LTRSEQEIVDCESDDAGAQDLEVGTGIAIDVARHVRIVNLPGGTHIIDVPTATEVFHVGPFYDVSFSEDGDAIVTGDALQRRIFRLAATASEPNRPPGFDPAGTCNPQGQVGQSNVGSVRSRNGKAVVLLPAIIAGAPVQIGQLVPSQRVSEAICGTSSVSVLVAPDGSSDLTALFSSFSPRDDRLAVVYGGKTPYGGWRSVIDVWNVGWDGGNWMRRLASFSIRGSVGYRIGWSQDARRLAAIRSTNDSTDALIYALP